MPRFSLCGGTYKAISPNFDGEEAINIFCENQDSPNAKTGLGMILAPGKKLFSAAGTETTMPGLFPINGRLFGASANFYEYLASGQRTNLGALNGAPLTPTQIIANQTQLLILSNGDLFVFTLATNALVAVNMAQFNGPVLQIDFSDGYALAVIKNSNTFQQSNLEDFTTWDGLNIATISLFPDNLVSLKVNDRYPTFFSGKKSVVYYNSGTGFPVFIPLPSGLIENGSGATFATAQLDNTIFWLDQNDRGAFTARRLSGVTGQRVSTHATEREWQSYGNASQAVGFAYQEEGHEFWGLYFPGQITWLYDVSTQLWHKRGRWNAVINKYEPDHVMSHAYAFGMQLVGDWATGNVYEQSLAYHTDDGHEIVWDRIAPIISKENKWLYHSELVVDVETGLQPTDTDIAMWKAAHGGVAPMLDGNGQPRQPQIILSWSDNYGKNWSNEYLLNCGFLGQFGKLVRKQQLGRAYNRVYRIRGSDPIPWYIADGYAYWDVEQAVERMTQQYRKVT